MAKGPLEIWLKADVSTLLENLRQVNVELHITQAHSELLKARYRGDERTACDARDTLYTYRDLR